jgi:formate/nitrite transporter
MRAMEGHVTDAPTHPMAGMDAFSPTEIADLVRTRGVAKANAGVLPTLVLGVVAGAYIALGAVFSTTVATGSELGYGPTRLLVGVAFSLGLILVIVAGAELFTGNTLIVLAVASRRVTAAQLARNWTLVFVGNFVGAVSVAAMVVAGGWWQGADGAVGTTAVTIAADKASLPFGTVFVRGILANALVCLAVWLATGGRSVVDKVVAIVPTIAAFVAAGFEHSIANMYFFTAGLLIEGRAPGTADAPGLDLGGFGRNLTAATLGNIVGGGVLVALVYWFVYLRAPATASAPSTAPAATPALRPTTPSAGRTGRS